MQTNLRPDSGRETRACRLPPMAMKDERGRHYAAPVGRRRRTANEPKHHWFIQGRSSLSSSDFYLPPSLSLFPVCVFAFIWGALHACVLYFEELTKLTYCT